MDNANACPGTGLFQQLEKLRGEKGRVTAEDAGDIVARLMQPGSPPALCAEIAQMMVDIEAARHEIASLSGGAHTNRQAISDASAHLDTVAKSTGEASNHIMDAADAIGRIADGMDGEQARAIKGHCLRIYEACNFQDLASQRIARAIRLLRLLEGHIANLLALFGVDGGAPAARPQGEAALLNGPALPASAVSQDDVDALFKSLGSEK